MECTIRYRGQGRLDQDDIGVKTAELRGSHVNIKGQSVPSRKQEVERSGPGSSRTIKEASVAGAK